MNDAEMVQHWKSQAERLARSVRELQDEEPSKLKEFKKECLDALQMKSSARGRTVPEAIKDLLELSIAQHQALHHLERLYRRTTGFPWELEIVTGTEKSVIQLGVIDAISRLDDIGYRQP